MKQQNRHGSTSVAHNTEVGERPTLVTCSCPYQRKLMWEQHQKQQSGLPAITDRPTLQHSVSI